MDSRTEELRRIADDLGIDIDAPLPDFSDPAVIRRLGLEFTEQCLEELEAGDRAEQESRAGACIVPVWG